MIFPAFTKAHKIGRTRGYGSRLEAVLDVEKESLDPATHETRVQIEAGDNDFRG